MVKKECPWCVKDQINDQVCAGEADEVYHHDNTVTTRPRRKSKCEMTLQTIMYKIWALMMWIFINIHKFRLSIINMN